MFFSKRKLIVLLFLFFLAAGIVFLSSRQFVYSLRSLSLDIAKIPLSTLKILSNELRAFIFFHETHRENSELKKELDRFKAMNLMCEGLTAENARLKNLLELRNGLPYKTETASVIGKDFQSVRSFIILDKGSSRGVAKYDAVLTDFGLVGKVLETGRYSSKVILIYDPNLSVPAINFRTREHGLVSGTLDGRSKLRFLDSDSETKEGDLIVTSGMNMTYPEGIPIGKVKFIGSESSGLGKFAILEPAVKISSLEEALIVVSGPHE